MGLAQRDPGVAGQASFGGVSDIDSSPVHIRQHTPSRDGLASDDHRPPPGILYCLSMRTMV
jgi:hypothetical protein